MSKSLTNLDIERLALEQGWKRVDSFFACEGKRNTCKNYGEYDRDDNLFCSKHIKEFLY